jgi:hypothetical protein
MGYVQQEMERYGLDWSGQPSEFFDLYFGEGMRSVWKFGQSGAWWQGRPIDLPRWVGRQRKDREESVFFIPAQRVLALREGWPQPFAAYSSSVPFVVREFSERLRQLVAESNSNGILFPQDRRLKKEFRAMLARDLFAGFQLELQTDRLQKRLVLSSGDQALPFMVWSAGQREFVPLLLGLYWLMPLSKAIRREEIQWVVLEEPEMGLHPRAASVLLLMVLELVARGYRVCLSTHSPQVLEMVWALQRLTENQASPRALLNLFEAPGTPPMKRLVSTVMAKTFKVHFFNPETGRTEDISDLDPASDEAGEGGWGGLAEFSDRANAAVARAVANAKLRVRSKSPVRGEDRYAEGVAQQSPGSPKAHPGKAGRRGIPRPLECSPTPTGLHNPDTPCATPLGCAGSAMIATTTQGAPSATLGFDV